MYLSSNVAAAAYYLSDARYWFRVLKPEEAPSDVFKKSNYITLI